MQRNWEKAQKKPIKKLKNKQRKTNKGLSGSGKSTLSETLYKKLKEKGIKVEHLDGDSIRNIFPKTGFSKEERNMHIRRVGFLASKLEQNGVTIIASFISPYKESRDFVRELCDDFIEVHVSTPLEECVKREKYSKKTFRVNQ